MTFMKNQKTELVNHLISNTYEFHQQGSAATFVLSSIWESLGPVKLTDLDSDRHKSLALATFLPLKLPSTTCWVALNSLTLYVTTADTTPSLHAISFHSTFLERTGDDRGVNAGHNDPQSLFPSSFLPLWLCLPLDRFTGSRFLTVSRYMYVVWGYMAFSGDRPTKRLFLVQRDTHEWRQEEKIPLFLEAVTSLVYG